jgi:hypothetical protein
MFKRGRPKIIPLLPVVGFVGLTRPGRPEELGQKDDCRETKASDDRKSGQCMRHQPWILFSQLATALLQGLHNRSQTKGSNASAAAPSIDIRGRVGRARRNYEIAVRNGALERIAWGVKARRRLTDRATMEISAAAGAAMNGGNAMR